MARGHASARTGTPVGGVFWLPVPVIAGLLPPATLGTDRSAARGSDAGGLRVRRIFDHRSPRALPDTPAVLRAGTGWACCCPGGRAGAPDAACGEAAGGCRSARGQHLPTMMLPVARRGHRGCWGANPGSGARQVGRDSFGVGPFAAGVRTVPGGRTRPGRDQRDCGVRRGLGRARAESRVAGFWDGSSAAMSNASSTGRAMSSSPDIRPRVSTGPREDQDPVVAPRSPTAGPGPALSRHGRDGSGSAGSRLAARVLRTGWRPPARSAGHRAAGVDQHQ